MGEGGLMRFFGFLVLLAGLAIAFGYPYYQRVFNNFEIGTYRIYDEANGYQPVTVSMSSGDAPVEVKIRALARQEPLAAGSRVNIPLVANKDNVTLATSVTVFSTPPGGYDPRTSSSLTMEDQAIRFTTLTGGVYTFIATAGDLQDIELQAVDLVLTGRVSATDTSWTGLGYSLLAIGGVAFLLGGRRRVRTAEQASAKPRIGRASDIGRARPLDGPDPEPARRKEPEKPQRKWGRDGS